MPAIPRPGTPPGQKGSGKVQGGKAANPKGAGKSGGKGKDSAQGQRGAEGAGAEKGKVPCKFFGSAKGCSTESCPFSHDFPNSVAPCSFKQKGNCEKGNACPFRHSPWQSAAHARAHYEGREVGSVEISQQRFSQLHRGGTPAPKVMGKEHVELPELETKVEQEIQEETYGSRAMRMMEKMGYKAGTGLGKDSQGRTQLVAPCLALEQAAQESGLGLGAYAGAGRSSLAERAARMADARAHKRPRLQDGSFFQHNLLSDDESSAGEDEHIKAKDVKLFSI